MQKGETALHKAAKYAHIQVIDMLLEAQASIDGLNEVCYNYTDF